MAAKNLHDTELYITLQVSELHGEELEAIAGGTDWCGTGLPNHGIPQYPLPKPRDVFGDVVKLA
jgi:hypothetical protein